MQMFVPRRSGRARRRFYLLYKRLLLQMASKTIFLNNPSE